MESICIIDDIIPVPLVPSGLQPTGIQMLLMWLPLRPYWWIDAISMDEYW